MKADGKDMTEEELDAHAEAMICAIRELIKCADRLGFDRDSYLEAATSQLAVMAACSTFENFKLEDAE